jgi:hypothetical protein
VTREGTPSREVSALGHDVILVSLSTNASAHIAWRNLEIRYLQTRYILRVFPTITIHFLGEQWAETACLWLQEIRLGTTHGPPCILPEPRFELYSITHSLPMLLAISLSPDTSRPTEHFPLQHSFVEFAPEMPAPALDHPYSAITRCP